MVDSNVRITGALAPHGEGLWAALLQRGYTPLSARNLMRLAAHLRRWLDEQNRSLESLTPDSTTASKERLTSRHTLDAIDLKTSCSLSSRPSDYAASRSRSSCKLTAPAHPRGIIKESA